MSAECTHPRSTGPFCQSRPPKGPLGFLKGATQLRGGFAAFPRDLWQKFLRALKAKGGDQKAKLFQFLNKIGARALRIQLGRVLEMAESSPDRQTYERKIVERFGGQKQFEFIIPAPAEMKEAAH